MGGTTLTVAGGAYVSESVWLTSERSSGTEGGGGGISGLFTIPNYQVGLVSSASLGSNTMRNVPDVALNADPQNGYFVVVNCEFFCTCASYCELTGECD